MNDGNDRIRKLSENMKALRLDSRMTQAELGKIFGLNYRTISSYENNTLCPGVDIIIKYCDFFAVRPDDLFGYREASSGHRRLIITDDNEARIIESYRNAPDWVQEAIDIVALKAYDHHRAVRRNRPHVPVGIAENSPAYDTEEEKDKHENNQR